MEVSENVMCRSLQAHRRSQAPPLHRTQPVSDWPVAQARARVSADLAALSPPFVAFTCPDMRQAARRYGCCR